jgi:hypothetical protein
MSRLSHLEWRCIGATTTSRRSLSLRRYRAARTRPRQRGRVGLAAIGASLLVKALVAIVPLALAVYWLRTIGAAAFLRLDSRRSRSGTPVAVASSWSFVRSPGDIALLFGLANAALALRDRFTPVKSCATRWCTARRARRFDDPALAKGVLLIVAFRRSAALMLYCCRARAALRPPSRPGAGNSPPPCRRATGASGMRCAAALRRPEPARGPDRRSASRTRSGAANLRDHALRRVSF